MPRLNLATLYNLILISIGLSKNNIRNARIERN
jgi:hypothetical protein